DATVITVASYPGETATLDSIPLSANTDGSYVSYWVFDRLHFRGYWCNCGNGEVHHIRISNSDIDGTLPPYVPANTPDYGDMLVQAGGPYFQVVNSKIHDAGYNGTPTPCYSDHNVNYGCYGFYITSNHMLIDHNQIYNNGGWGIHLYNSGYT